jgi:hypothetical protein
MLITYFLLAIIPVIDTILIVYFLKKWLNRKIELEKQIISDRIKDFVTSPDEKTPSELAQYVSELSPIIAHMLYKSLIASLNQEKGVIQRKFNDAEVEGVEAIIADQMPTASLLMQLLPNKMKKSLLKNPALFQAGASLLSGANNPNNGNGNGNSNSSVRGRIKNG